METLSNVPKTLVLVFSSQICALNLYAAWPFRIVTILCLMDLIFHWVKKKITKLKIKKLN